MGEAPGQHVYALTHFRLHIKKFDSSTSAFGAAVGGKLHDGQRSLAWEGSESAGSVRPDRLVRGAPDRLILRQDDQAAAFDGQ